MIHNIKLKNFYSVKEEQEISFEVDNKAPENNGYLISADKRVSKINMIVGPNASGKTNALKAISFLKWFIGESFNMSPNMPLAYKKFFDSQDPTEITVSFSINDIVYTYFLNISYEKILIERLSKIEMVNIRKTEKILFEKSWSKEKKMYVIKSSQEDDGLIKSLDVIQRGNTSIIGIGYRNLNPLYTSIAMYWSSIQTNVYEKGYNVVNPFELAINMLNLEMNLGMKNKVESILKRYDLGFDSVKPEIEKNGLDMTYKNAKEIHSFGGKIYENDIDYASNGTKRLLSIISMISVAIENKVPVFIDEIDAFLHPDILREIIDIFFDEDTYSQIVFTSHSHIVMNKLDKQQIHFSEKNKEGFTEMFRLDDIEGVKADQNFFNKYIAGAYGAIPKI
jgi:AAA15 family ATPase/GTPase